MSPEERQLLAGLFDRIRNASGQVRDREAETFITDAVRTQPYAPYLLAQTVIVQEQALRAANDRLGQYEGRIRELEEQNAKPQSGGFLGGLGGLFGGGQPARASEPTPTPAQQGPWGGAPGPQAGGWGGGPAQQGGWGGGPAQGGAPQGGWGQQPGYGQAPAGGGGFLKGALGAAAGVAGGVLLADSMRSLFHGGNNSLGIGSGLGGSTPGGAATTVNNYYGDSNNDDGGYASSGGGRDDATISDADYSSDGGSSNDDDGGGYA